MIAEVNKSKILIKYISCEYQCRFDGRKCNSDQRWVNDKCWCKCKKCYVYEKDVWDPATCYCQNGKYLASTMDDSWIIGDEVIYADKDVEAKSNDESKSNEEAKSNDETNFNKKKATCKTQKFYISLAFLLITIALLRGVSIYCYLTKYRPKQEQLLPFHDLNNELRDFLH